MAEMSPAVIVELCKKNGGYRQPHLNDQLYLQCRGFRQIQNLEPYINCKALWLDQNAISEVENLEHFTDLATLFLQDNAIRRLSSSCFNGLHNLRILNLSNNHLSRIVGLEAVPLLETLEIAKNRFETLESIRNIMVCQKLSSVDVSSNMIERIGSAETEHHGDDENGDDENGDDKDGGNNNNDGGDCPDNAEKDQAFINADNAEKLVAFWQRLPELGVLYLHGNELPRRCKFYRKKMIVGLPQLMYLDERPIFPDERRTTEAWGRGGNSAEDAERNLIREEKMAEMEKNIKGILELKGQNREVREKAEKERAKKLEEEKEWKNAMQVTWACERTEMDHLEYEQRAYLENEEVKAFEKFFGQAAVNKSIEIVRVAEERRRLEEEVKREVEEEEKRIEREMAKQRNQIRARHEEMKKAIDMFKEQNDDVILTNKGRLDISKSEALMQKQKQEEDEEREVNQKALENLREEEKKDLIAAMQPKSEDEVMDDLFDVVLPDVSSKSNNNLASRDNDQQQQQQQQHSTASRLPSAVSLLEQQQETAAANLRNCMAEEKKKGSKSHWDAFLAMENTRGTGKKRRF